jgi:hypothetical protein
MIRPSDGVGCESYSLICFSEKQKYFCQRGLTGVSQNDPSGKSVELRDGSIHVAELHWYEAAGIGRKEFKIKHLL